MKPSLLFPFLFLFLNVASAQNRKYYNTSGGEMIFSWANYQDSGVQYTGPPRFTIFFHVNQRLNIDFNKYSGMGIGLGIRNIGFITKNEEPNTKIKRRTYTIGLPVYFKFGNMDSRKYLMIGGEYEVAFHYKFKRFVNGVKTEKQTEWFSAETNRFLPSVFIAYNYGAAALKFQYYLDDLMNRDYVKRVDGIDTKPYSQVTSGMFFISIMGNVFSERSENVKKKEEKAKRFMPPASPAY